MKRNRYRIFAIALCSCLVFAALLSGCGVITGFLKSKPGASAPSSTAIEDTVSAGGTQSTDGAAAPDAGSQTPGGDEFAAAFRTVDKNPLNETIQYVLWLTANDPAADATADPGGASTGLAALIDKYNALVASTGVHYTQTKDALGMQMISEVWMKAGKFKVVDQFMNEVVVFDGESFVKYNPDEKTGTRYSKEMMAGDIDSQLYGSVRSNSASAFQQGEDEQVGSFDCGVYYMEMNAMGITKVVVCVDKETGIVAKYATQGDLAMTFTVTSLEAGGFGDEVFTVPEDIVLEDYQ